jgi:hypothetical protein
LIEQLTVLAMVSMLVAFSVPAVKALVNSFETSGGAEMMISSALATGRAIAAKQQRYAGVRFQCRYDATKPAGLGREYMIFIVHDTNIRPEVQGNLSFRAVEGTQPIKLPEKVGVTDLTKNKNQPLMDTISDNDLEDATTFSIIFSPSGKLVIHEHWVRNRDGDMGSGSEDDVFNTLINVRDNNIGLFVQDETFGNRQIEPSRREFVIYDREVFESTDANRRYTDYLEDLKVIRVNPYTGRIIE